MRRVVIPPVHARLPGARPLELERRLLDRRHALGQPVFVGVRFQRRARKERRASGSSWTLPDAHRCTPRTSRASPGLECDVVSALPFCRTFPRNQFEDVYDGLLADDEHIVAFRYKVSKRLCG